MTPEDKSKIDELKKSLYSRSAPNIRAKRRLHFSQPTLGEVKTDWEHPQEEEIDATLNRQYEDTSMSFFTKLFIGSIIFFIIAVGIGAYLMFNGSNIISANNIDIIVNGPVTTAGGDPVSLDVQVSNKNNIKLEKVDFSVQFPAGTVEAVDRSKELREYRELMSDIVPGGIGQKSVRAVMYGEENSKKEILITVSYRVAGSNAVFKKQRSYEVLISSSPLSLSISSFKEVTSGQEFEFNVQLTSNSEETIRNLLLKALFPFGFTFISSDPKPEAGSTLWKIGDIPPKGKRTITIRGKLEGQDDEVRAFRFTAGAQSSRDVGAIGTEYIAAAQEISIKKPFISTTISFDSQGGTEDFIGSFDRPVNATITWFNNLPTSIIDGEIHVKLSGTSYDKLSISPGEGNFKSADNEIVWNRQTTASLANIGAGESGSVTFTFTPRRFSTPTKLINNPNMLVDVSVQGKRLSETNVPEAVASSVKRLVKISSQLSLTSVIARSMGGIINTGPIPPRAEKETTYTVIWTVDNTSNTVTDGEVRALLPAYVKWVDKVSPLGEDISYNSSTGEVVWRVGNVDAHTLNTSRRKQVAFQISFNPSVAQIGQVPILVQDTTLTGQDDFTGVRLTDTKPALTTRFASDPTYRDGSDVVAK